MYKTKTNTTFITRVDYDLLVAQIEKMTAGIKAQVARVRDKLQIKLDEKDAEIKILQHNSDMWQEAYYSLKTKGTLDGRTTRTQGKTDS